MNHLVDLFYASLECSPGAFDTMAGEYDVIDIQTVSSLPACCCPCAASRITKQSIGSNRQVKAILRDAHPGMYLVYLSCEPVDIPSDQFLGVSISFRAEGAELTHKLAFQCLATRGAWAAFCGWMTIHPAPWATNDAVGALQSKMLFPSLDEMCDALPELTERIYAPTLPSGALLAIPV